MLNHFVLKFNASLAPNPLTLLPSKKEAKKIKGRIYNKLSQWEGPRLNEKARFKAGLYHIPQVSYLPEFPKVRPSKEVIN